MSTDLYGYRVLHRKGPKLTVKVFNVYSDMRGFFPSPNNPTFFYGIVAEMNKSLQEEIGSDWYSEENMQRLGPQYIRHVDITDIMNPFAEMEHDFYYERNGKWKGEELLPQVTYEIEVSDERDIKPIRKGHSAGTTMYQAEMELLDTHSDIPEVDQEDLDQLATLPWSDNIKGMQMFLETIDFGEQDVISWFNARIPERDKLLDRLRLLSQDPQAKHCGWTGETIHLLNAFKMKDGADEALRHIMAGDFMDTYLRALAKSAGHHPAYISSALKEQYAREEGLTSRLWMSYTLYLDSGEEEYFRAFSDHVDRLMAPEGDDAFWLGQLCADVWKYAKAEELLPFKDIIKKLSGSPGIWQDNAIKLVARTMPELENQL